ncbi:MAG: ankyrin repeat domain-containing protein, partial [Synergistaceae bacterium]|nr:ankyrin repeat domain-containing protein [Synergistaceae bacterium]
AHVNMQDIHGNTALIYAAYYNNEDVVETLLDAGADISVANTSGNSAYDYGKKNYRLADTETLKKLKMP